MSQNLNAWERGIALAARGFETPVGMWGHLHNDVSAGVAALAASDSSIQLPEPLDQVDWMLPSSRIYVSDPDLMPEGFNPGRIGAECGARGLEALFRHLGGYYLLSFYRDDRRQTIRLIRSMDGALDEAASDLEAVPPGDDEVKAMRDAFLEIAERHGSEGPARIRHLGMYATAFAWGPRLARSLVPELDAFLDPHDQRTMRTYVSAALTTRRAASSSDARATLGQIEERFRERWNG